MLLSPFVSPFPPKPVLYICISIGQHGVLTTGPQASPTPLSSSVEEVLHTLICSEFILTCLTLGELAVNLCFPRWRGKSIPDCVWRVVLLLHQREFRAPRVQEGTPPASKRPREWGPL